MYKFSNSSKMALNLYSVNIHNDELALDGNAMRLINTNNQFVIKILVDNRIILSTANNSFPSFVLYQNSTSLFL